jgi:hypothetical protein
MTWQKFIRLLFVFAFYLSETAFGYKGLKILLYYIAGSLSTLFRVEYSSKVDENFDCVEVRIERNIF